MSTRKTKPLQKKTVSARARDRTEEVPTWQEDPTVPERDPEATAELPMDDEVTDPEREPQPPRYGSARPDGKKTAIAVLEPRGDPRADEAPPRRRRAELPLSASGTAPTALAVLTPLAPGMREPAASALREVLDVDTGDIVVSTPIPRRTQVPIGGQTPSSGRARQPKRPRRK